MIIVQAEDFILVCSEMKASLKPSDLKPDICASMNNNRVVCDGTKCTISETHAPGKRCTFKSLKVCSQLMFPNFANWGL